MSLTDKRQLIYKLTKYLYTIFWEIPFKLNLFIGSLPLFFLFHWPGYNKCWSLMAFFWETNSTYLSVCVWVWESVCFIGLTYLNKTCFCYISCYCCSSSTSFCCCGFICLFLAYLLTMTIIINYFLYLFVTSPFQYLLLFIAFFSSSESMYPPKESLWDRLFHFSFLLFFFFYRNLVFW